MNKRSPLSFCVACVKSMISSDFKHQLSCKMLWWHDLAESKNIDSSVVLWIVLLFKQSHSSFFCQYLCSINAFFFFRSKIIDAQFSFKIILDIFFVENAQRFIPIFSTKVELSLFDPKDTLKVFYSENWNGLMLVKPQRKLGQFLPV